MPFLICAIMLHMKTIALLNCSNPCSKERVKDTISFFESEGYRVKVSPYLYSESTPIERASVFNAYMKENIPFIFDVSGGDLANSMIPYIDLNLYEKSTSIFHGYSDLTCVLNVLAPIRPCVLFQVCQNTNQKEILDYLSGNEKSLIVKKAMGGNIRCLLKLAGTSYFPNLKGQDLFLESRSGDIRRIESYLSQLEMMGVMDGVRSITFGQFTQLQEMDQYEWLKKRSQVYTVPVSFLDCVGHSKDSKAVRLEMK